VSPLARILVNDADADGGSFLHLLNRRTGSVPA
jgi:hypothetical protein